MKLSEDRKTVDALKQILTDYDYLEYDEVRSKRTRHLHVHVSYSDINHDISGVIGHICRRLKKETGREYRHGEGAGAVGELRRHYYIFHFKIKTQ